MHPDFLSPLLEKPYPTQTPLRMDPIASLFLGGFSQFKVFFPNWREEMSRTLKKSAGNRMKTRHQGYFGRILGKLSGRLRPPYQESMTFPAWPEWAVVKACWN